EQVADEGLELGADHRDLHLDVAVDGLDGAAAVLGQADRAVERAGLAGDLDLQGGAGAVLPLLALDDLDLVADELLRERRDALGRLRLVDHDLHGLRDAVDADVAAGGAHGHADLLAEGRVGEHREHVGGGGVVGHPVRELHARIMPYPRRVDDDSGTGSDVVGQRGEHPEVQFGEQGARLTYGSYLQLGRLLSAQRLESDPPAHDELLFITIHQVYELWFQQLLHEATAARDAMQEGRTWWAQHLLQRMHVIERVLVQQVDVLETMTPQDFLQFRQRLAPASGFQSVQFRELEFLSGAKDPSYLKRFKGLTEAEKQRLQRRLDEPTLWDAFLS